MIKQDQDGPDMTVVEKTTKSQAIYGALAEAIASGRLQPGEALDEVQMAKTYGVSRTPVREAIRRLETTGLVCARSHRGAVVTGLSERQLDDLFAVTAELEALCARWAALAMTADERRGLRALHDGTAPLVEARQTQLYADRNVVFHEALYRGAHNAYLAELVFAARRRTAPFRQAQFHGGGRLRNSFREHEAIVAAIEAGDADAAHERMRAHIVVVRTALEAVVAPAEA